MVNERRKVMKTWKIGKIKELLENIGICPECQEEGSIDYDNNEWYVFCKCHETPYCEDPFEALESWKNYCKGGIK